MGNRNLFISDITPKLPSENLAINRECARLVSNSDYDTIVRVYKHKPGVILGKSQSLFDVFEENCDRDNLEIAVRDTGGAAVYVNEELALCYSVFTTPQTIGESPKDITNIYRKMTIPLAKLLGVSVKGTYYLKKDNRTLAGHSLSVTKPMKRDVLHFDGLVHLTPISPIAVGNYIKLRRLYEDHGLFLEVGDDIFICNGKKVSPYDDNISTANLVRDERDDIDSFLSLEEIALSETDFLDNLRIYSENLFGGFDFAGRLENSENIFDKQPKHLFEPSQQRKSKSNLGHCFVYIEELEGPEVVHYVPQ